MNIKSVPTDILSLIPKYDGEANLLNLFLSKCDYVVNGCKIEGNPEQELYLFHVVSSRLTGRAAILLNYRPNIKNYDHLKDLLIQHFGDSRSEECIAIELENLTLKFNESFIQFCHRIQGVRSSLFSKVDMLTDEGVKAAKIAVYNNTALNVFLYNLPEDLIRIVRLKGCCDLESALSIVTEEVNFKNQYDAKNIFLKHTSAHAPFNVQNSFNPLHMSQYCKPAFNPVPNNNFRFGIPQNNFHFGVPQNNFGFRPNFGQPGTFSGQGFSSGIPHNQPSYGSMQSNVQRAPFQQNNFRFGIPHQQKFKFGIANQCQPNINENKLAIAKQQDSLNQNTDVSLLTAPVRQNMVKNELFHMEQPTPRDISDVTNEYGYDYYKDETEKRHDDTN